MFREPVDSMKVITFDEQASYLSETSQPLHDIAKIILDTGLRPEEVFRMRSENLDFKVKAIFNPSGKTKAARRTIPMTGDAVSLLSSRVKEATKNGTPYVFPSPHDIQKPIGSVKKAHRSAIERAGIKHHFRLYDLRHTFAHSSCCLWHRSADAQFIAGSHEYSDDNALCPPGRRTEADCDEKVREI